MVQLKTDFMTVDRMLIWIFYLFYNNIELIKLEINYMEHIYGDLFYPLRRWLQAPLNNPQLNPQQATIP